MSSTDTLTASARCLQGCPLPADGPAAADREAEKHTRKTGHATATVTMWAREGQGER